MNSLFLVESPIHFIDGIEIEVDAGNFTPKLALIMLNLTLMIRAMNKYDHTAIKKIAVSDANTTKIALGAFQKYTSANTRMKAIAAFNKENKTKILNDIKWLKRQLIDRIYKPAGIQVHNDI